MKIARATTEDIDAAREVMQLIDAIQDGYFPQTSDSEVDPEEFDKHNVEHLRRFHSLIMRAAHKRPCALSRVIEGMDTIIFNNILDPDSTTLELHPDLKRLDSPTPAVLTSMALRYRHDFGLLTPQEQASVLRQMEQLWEEVAGK